jgi:hypothetical protein
MRGKRFLKSTMRMHHESRWTSNIKKASRFIDSEKITELLLNNGFKPTLDI